MKLIKIANQLNEDISNYNSYLILPHVMADGDAVGCCIAMTRFLQSIGKKALMLMEEKIPYIYSFMQNSCDIEIFSPLKEYDYDICIAIDTGDIERLGKRKEIFNKCISYNIDHHKTNEGYALNNYVNENVSSSGEIIYELFKKMNVQMDHDIAQALYVAISTDTGGFRYQNTNKKSFKIAAELMDYGINIEKISEWVFERTNMNKLHLFEKTIQNIKFYCDNKVAVSTLRNDEYMHLDVSDEDFEGLVNTVKNIEGVEIGVFLRERPDKKEVKGSLRSNTDNVDVSLIAKLYGGGGHSRAAGLVTTRSIDDIYNSIIKTISEIYKCTE
ncbi:MAG TPA: bifunctional oligoribonuclease/PAP phosphatase NrnA [Clostridia bacterium]|nr:MAG: Bifunctional oligoribonuclease and PAP phosphatase NrnA [Firmicutes bacterium ADurb.Bin146]HOD92734.1 bifunctional oligoribonuclease/PAP phosphatase NrnA [Clostridia bacterium]